MNTQLKLGEHYLCELSQCDTVLLHDADSAIEVFFHAIHASGLTVLAESSHKFAPHGFSAFTLLAESHASVHAWPEYGYCAIDVFTCNLRLDLEPLFRRLQQDFRAANMKLELVDRSARWDGPIADRPGPAEVVENAQWSPALPAEVFYD